MRLNALIIILSVLMFQVALADGELSQDECTSIDIRDKNPHLKIFFSTPRDQDSIGWCYAFAAADLLSAEMGIPISINGEPSFVRVSNSSKKISFCHLKDKWVDLESLVTAQE